jgi:hypothetical protein
LSNCAEDNQQIQNNIPRHQEEDIQRENINALTKNLSCMLARSSVGGDLSEFEGESKKWPAFITANKTSRRICGYTPAENVLRLRKFLRGMECMVVWKKKLTYK